ncbi:MAG: helix-hairpin-helix domain-containing protein [Atopobiaceae bacterium]|nr:helix-hairpin-helix domain-containing protein [Atopobiaceae bacterium]
MAQGKALQRRARALVRRFGLAGSTVAIVACVIVMAGAICIGILANGQRGVTIERNKAEVPTQEEDFEQEDTAGDDKETPLDRSVESDETNAHEIVVHVDGAVAVPGVYTLGGEAARYNDAVELAGGLLPDADTAAINLAQCLVDGQKVHVPFVGEQVVQPETTEVAAQTSEQDAPRESEGNTVNINTASADELQRLPGVGEATAASIVDDRERNGAFSSKEDLMRVSGIGEKKFEKMRGMIDV